MIKKELLLASWLEKLQKKWDNEEYYYDVEEATKVFKFVSKLTNDRGASRQFELLEFQFEIITEILCVKRRSDGKRKHREAHINIPRKNGKSFLAAIIVVYLFFCQRHIFGALFILTANTTKQAGELYATVEHFIKTNKTLPSLSTPERKKILLREKKRSFTPLSWTKVTYWKNIRQQKKLSLHGLAKSRSIRKYRKQKAKQDTNKKRGCQNLTPFTERAIL